MKFLNFFLTLYFYIYLFPFSKEEIIHNPIKSEKQFNPINYQIIYLTEITQIQIGESQIN